MHPDRSHYRPRPLPKSRQSARWSDVTSATQQFRAVQEFTARCMDAPRLRREEQRQALVAARSEHRQNSGYEAVDAEYQRAMRAYVDDTYFREFAKDCYLAGVSMIPPRRSLRRAHAIEENQRRLEWREKIIEHARQLDAIDEQGGFDSSDEFLLPSLGPPEGDTHHHRAWIAILEADRRRLAHIIRRRRLRSSRWLARAAARYALACLWAAVVVAIAVELDDKALQIAMLFPVLALPAWMKRRARTKDRFVEQVLAIQHEHRMARRTLLRHVGRPLRVDPPTGAFARDPQECQLTELLGGTLSR